MAKIIGAFVFKDDGDGCLTAKWLNNDETTAYPESSKLVGENLSDIKFEGMYTTTWIEQSTSVKHSDLEIRRTHQAIYSLKWTKGTNVIFYGTAMLYGDLLIGSYWQ